MPSAHIAETKPINTYATEAFISQVKEARRTIASAIRAITPSREPDKLSADAVAAYTDVVRQGDAIYRQEQNDIQDRRAIRTFVDRFRALAALATLAFFLCAMTSANAMAHPIGVADISALSKEEPAQFNKKHPGKLFTGQMTVEHVTNRSGVYWS